MRLLATIIPLFAVLVTASPSLIRRAPLNPSVNSNTVALSPAGGGTYPRLANVNGAILAAYTAFDGDTHIITISRSTDGGKTFSAWGTVAQSTGDLDNPELIQLANGNIIVTFRNHDKNGSTYTYYRITACISTDGGATWTFLSQVAERAANGVNGLWEPSLRIAKSGALQVYYASENAANDQDILVQSSTNGGSSWSSPTTVAGGSTTGRDGMPGCTDFTVGGANKVICVFETTEGTGTFTVKSVLSHDDGATWGSRSQVYVPTGSSNNAGAPQITTTSSGTLVTSFMTDEDTSLHNWVNGANFKIITSQPLASPSWGQKTTVFPVQASWPGLLALSDGTVLGCADNSGAKCHSISFS